MSLDVSVAGGPTPDPEELAAIVAAVEVALSSGQAPDTDTPAVPPRWRFSGRWWSRPVPIRRERPVAF